MRHHASIASAASLALAAVASGQVAPPAALHPADLDAWAIVGVEAIPSPGASIRNATIVIRDGVIEAIGADLAVPPDCRVVDGKGLRAYPGLIEACAWLDSSDAATAASKGTAAHWNARIVPQVEVTALVPPAARRRELRELGFTSAAFHPDRGILRGSGAVWPLGDEPTRPRLERAMMAAAFEHGGDWDRATYPGAFIGATALLRQTLADARWHAECRERWSVDPTGLEPPIAAAALEAMAPVVAGDQRLLLRADDEREALVAAALAREMEVPLAIAASGTEFRRLAEVAATKVPLVVPVAFPEPPEVDSPGQAAAQSLRDLLSWEQAPTNPKRLLAAGCDVSLTTDRLKSLPQFNERIRDAMAAGLTRDEVLAALTLAPARLLGIDDVVGSLEPGKQADVVLVEGELFAEDAKVREVWVGGARHEVAPRPVFALAGEVVLALPDGSTRRMRIDPEKGEVEVWPAAPAAEAGAEKAPDEPPVEGGETTAAPGEGAPTQVAGEDAEGDAEADPAPESKRPPAKPRSVRATAVVVLGDMITMRLDGAPLGLSGPQRMSGVLIDGTLRLVAESEDGTVTRLAATAAPAKDAADGAGIERGGELAQGDAEAGGDAKDEDPSKGDEGDRKTAAKPAPPDWTRPLPVPLGEFGVVAPRAAERVLFRNATLWTCGAAGVVEGGDLLVEDGRIAYAGPRRAWRFESEAPREVDLAGRHVTPGLIDCHSHTGLAGGVNEWTSNSTAEVRMVDALDADEIDWYRQLAGGLTTANQLHGSANPIGGQNSVVKIRWGEPTAAQPIEDAIPAIKFALGENVVRPKDRYPQTRMGVEAFLDDAFHAARRLRAEQLDYAALPDDEKARRMPPRPDLRLEALAEILEGRRLVHCHSYRQDEILMLLRLAEQHGFTVGTLQHVLEGFKVADAIADHGAGASSFSDWWAYKMEVMDAIPENGAVMHRVGVLVSFNSDSDEHARRMNTEAAKAVRYGGLPPEEALWLVTINPARQLRIDHRVGSLEAGKDADFAVWSGPPLSSFSRCEQTWVDGIMRFDVAEDARLAAEAEAERQKLLAKAALARASRGKGGGSRGGGGDAGPPGDGKPGAPAPVGGFRARGMLGAMWQAREDAMLDFVRRGLDPMQAMPGGCGLEWGGGDASQGGAR